MNETIKSFVSPGAVPAPSVVVEPPAIHAPVEHANLYDPEVELRLNLRASTIVAAMLEVITVALLLASSWLTVTVTVVAYCLWWLITFVLLTLWSHVRSPASRQHRALSAQIRQAERIGGKNV